MDAKSAIAATKLNCMVAVSGVVGLEYFVICLQRSVTGSAGDGGTK